ncbi:MAG: toprim domain-containing protein [Alphaproteobacteria bacterium]|nr:toprim domain-containing protein [Alphaproteobacteria bacterium]MBU1561114.1 toprim domain-containing protein [Alphaproteobacteria bacterium]MBU2301870.1 toprim domain-containing protein [Alphaproteobacteria bacterium]MBU2368730.1 toprim domain-containing protein [Alphaproteobacteria bacterium]
MDYKSAIELVRKAREHCDQIFIHLIGNPNPHRSNSAGMRWHDDGKLLLNLAAGKRGTWHNFSTEEHGDVCAFVQAELNLSWREAIDWLASWFGSSTLSLPASTPSKISPVAVARPQKETKTFGLELFHKSHPSLENSPGYAYLQKRLCGFLPTEVVEGGSLRFSPGHRRMEGRTFPNCIGALLALITDATTGEPTGCHRTFIDANFDRIERGILGNQGVIRLFPDHLVETTLAVGEGIETCLSAHLLLEGPPVWSCINAGGLSGLPVLNGVEALTIYADNDENEIGQRKARQAFERWREAGVAVTLHVPRATSVDFNKMLVELVSLEVAE